MTVNEFEKRAAFQNGYDREIGNWKVIDVHQIPDILNEHHEIDFYCSNGAKVFLLRLRNRKTEFYEKINLEGSDSIPYLIAELPINKKVDNTLIKIILDKFNLNN